MVMPAFLHKFIIAESLVEVDCSFSGDMAIFIFVVNAARMKIFKHSCSISLMCGTCEKAVAPQKPR